ncbi:MAG: NERD domain-containing protein [Alcanivorax sp.]|nr:NERD domain-containing protein [Alcanivorax sp.]
MAKVIPQLSTLRSMTSGERRLGQRLETLLEDDYTVWYDIPVGRRRRYPDFIILHPGRGLLFLEVKDWKPDTLKRITPHDAEIHTPQGLKTVSNPLEQVRQCAYVAVNQLQRDEQLIQRAGRFRGNLCFPYGYGVVLPNITRKQWNEAISEQDQELVLPPHRLICRDEMTATVDPEAFQSQLWDMFEYAFGDKLTLPQIDRIRWNLFPEVRINAPQQDLFAVSDVQDAEEPARLGVIPDAIPDIIRVMDLQQEQLARSMGEGHRVVHGVAGSGKTLILGYRCLYLAQAVSKPILVLCFNITLAAKLRSFIAEKGIDQTVQVHHFHEWCGLQLKTYNVDLQPGSGEQYWERQVTTVIQAVDKGQIPRGQYSAVMIDEGHDFEQTWLKLIVQMIDPDTNSLLLLYDDAQSIYKRSGSLAFPLSSAGIQARGRTTILKLNYRNSREILSFAYDFARDFMHAQDADEDHIPLIAPEVAGNSGPAPEFRKFDNFNDEAHYIARCIRKWHLQGQPLDDIAVIYGHHRQAEILQRALMSHDIPCAWLRSTADKKRYNANADRVTLLTRQSSKGLEFDTVVLAGLGGLEDDEEHLEQEVRLLYVGMTRARQQLLLTGAGENWFVRKLNKA